MGNVEYVSVSGTTAFGYQGPPRTIDSETYHRNAKEWIEKKWQEEDEDTHLDDLMETNNDR